MAVVGYACLDKSMAIREFRGFDATSIVTRGTGEREPGIGGSAHIARAVAASGASASVISWVAADLGGARWLRSLTEAACDTSAVVVGGSRSPSATMIEVGTGETICLFDPGDVHPTALSEEQLDVLQRSSWVVVTVAPGPLTDAVLEVLPPAARLAWAVKHDDDVYSPARMTRLLARADLVSCSRGERSYIFPEGTDDSAKRGALLVETLGAGGVAWSIAGDPARTGTVRVDAVPDVDTTGAGDTFVGTLVGLIADKPPMPSLVATEIDALVAGAAAAVRQLLLARFDGRTIHESTTKEHSR